MIIKNAIYGDKHNVHLLKFGFGTVHMRNAKDFNNEKGDVTFSTGEAREIGEELPSEPGNDDVGVVFRFYDQRSIDAVIEQLKELKKFLNEPSEMEINNFN